MYRSALSIILFVTTLFFSCNALAVDIQRLQPQTPWTYNQDGDRVFRVNPDGVQFVVIDPKITPTFFVKASLVTAVTTLAVTAPVYSDSIEVADATGVNIGDYLGLFNTTTDRYYVGNVYNVVGDVLSLDFPTDSQFEVGDVVGTGVTNMAVDGSVTPKIFSVRGADPGVGIVVNITRIIITCETASPVDLTKFGDLPKLTRGLLMRRVDGNIKNIIGWKDNFELMGSMYDFNQFAATNPQQGVDGFVARLTFASEGKVGVALQIAPGDEIQFPVLDNLTGLIRLEIMLEGYEVE